MPVPHILKHCTLAIFKSGDIAGGQRKRFLSSWNVARFRLTQYGFLVAGSDECPVEKIKLTAKGTKREAFHANEPGGKMKSSLFDQMFHWVAEAAAAADATEKSEVLDDSQAARGVAEKEKHEVAKAKPTGPLLKKPSSKKEDPKPSGPFKKQKAIGKKKPLF